MPRSKAAEDLGLKIKAAREERNLSRQELGDLVGLSGQQINRIERGDSDVNAITLARIAKVTDQDVGRLLSEILTIQEQAEFLWEHHKLGKKLPGSQEADFKAKKEILESMGLWEE
ncbi:helix-turn-helix transcriptional regulator [Acidobacteria bacterium AH-259-D05]|nr:helix-turn-helix transcriptional regulator [Acidobacteria bacterium AH-259-D05]